MERKPNNKNRITKQRSWETEKKSMNMAKEAMKKQFNKKRCNLQGLKPGDNMWLEAKNIQLK